MTVELSQGARCTQPSCRYNIGCSVSSPIKWQGVCMFNEVILDLDGFQKKGVPVKRIPKASWHV